MEKEIRFDFVSADDVKRFCDVLSLLLENKRHQIEMSSDGTSVTIKVSSKKKVFLEKALGCLKKIKKEDMSNIAKFVILVKSMKMQPNSATLNRMFAIL